MTLEAPLPLRWLAGAAFCVVLGAFFLFYPDPDALAGKTLRGVGFLLGGGWLFAAHYRLKHADLIGCCAVILLIVGYALRYGDMLYRLGAWLVG